MNEKDKKMMEKLTNDKEGRYKVIVDNDSIDIEDTIEGDTVYTFSDFGDDFIVMLFKYFNINAELC